MIVISNVVIILLVVVVVVVALKFWFRVLDGDACEWIAHCTLAALSPDFYHWHWHSNFLRCPLVASLSRACLPLCLHSFGLDLRLIYVACRMLHCTKSEASAAQRNGQPGEYATHALNCRCFISHCFCLSWTCCCQTWSLGRPLGSFTPPPPSRTLRLF